MTRSVLAQPVLQATAFVTLLALLLYAYMGATVSAMRDRFGVQPPAVSGPPLFERAYRAHQNTLESLPLFLPTLWLAAVFFTPARWLPAAVGCGWILGRFHYMRGYLAAVEKRTFGLRLQALSLLANLGLALAGLALTARPLSSG